MTLKQQQYYSLYAVYVSIVVIAFYAIPLTKGVCKTRTGYLGMADADGKMRIEKCGWKK